MAQARPLSERHSRKLATEIDNPGDPGLEGPARGDHGDVVLDALIAEPSPSAPAAPAEPCGTRSDTLVRLGLATAGNERWWVAGLQMSKVSKGGSVTA